MSANTCTPLDLPLTAVGETKKYVLVGVGPDRRRAAIEEDRFPFEKFCDLAELESWRKEVNRPPYYIHKWWARRLGSVFRAMIIGSLTPGEMDQEETFYRPIRFPNATVFDPFMGSGTTIGEALKLGCRAIGRDINPVAHFAVKNTLTPHSYQDVSREFTEIEKDVAGQIQHFYEARLPEGELARSLYYFWVKVVGCPCCGKDVDLFGSYIFARRTSPKQESVAHVVCPACGAVGKIRNDACVATCLSCNAVYDPRGGPANGTRATCRNCRHIFPIAETVREAGEPPKHRLYAKLILTAEGEKRYLPADDFDLALYAEAVAALETRGRSFLPGRLSPGYNTNQAMNYCYLHWRDMFNDRQLLCLGTLADRIRSIEKDSLRDLFVCLFSGVLEFNNMFASYKGEGTGAVRHMFSHHILKPERTPLEANPWGTSKSSGAFSTLFKSRILRALRYCENPFEIAVNKQGGKRTGEKIFGLSQPLGHKIVENFGAFGSGERLYLSCGDSGNTDLTSGSVDVVITDPPFFDNVHYSQLADFFHVWQQYILVRPRHYAETTRSDREVQRTDADEFAARLGGIWKECARVLRPGGLLVFTYHHSRLEGWRSVFDAVTSAGFVIVAAHPIKAEMSVAAPKSQAKEPIDLDIILVCRRRGEVPISTATCQDAWNRACEIAGDQIGRLRQVGRRLSRNDIRIVIMAQVVRFLSIRTDVRQAGEFLGGRNERVEEMIKTFDVHRTVEPGQ